MITVSNKVKTKKKIYLAALENSVLNLSLKCFKNYSVITMIGLAMLCHFIVFNKAFGDAVPLLRIHSDNKTLDRGLPLFYDCIDNAIDHSVKKQKDPYFKNEPTLNEVLKCYYKTFVNGTSVKHSEK
jgi:hypothetical protein